MDDKTELIVLTGSAIVILVAMFAFIGFAYVHDTKTVTITEKEMSNGFAYTFTSDNEYYTVPNLGVYGSLKVGYTYAVSTAIHVVGTPRNLDSAVEV